MLKLVVLLFAVVACAYGAILPEDMLPQTDGRIVGGVPADITTYPWQVSIQRAGSHVCAGAIYNNAVVVTAAHCLVNITSSQLMVRVGSSYWNSTGSVVGVKNFRIHENYSPITMANDIAVIRLATNLIYSATINYINLSSNNAYNGEPAIVTGWGTGEYGISGYSTFLEAVQVNMITETTCASYTYGYGSRIMPSMLCASAPGKDACQGDSGGPLVSGGRLYGLVSWGFGCANSNYPGVYTSIPYLHSWIFNAANNIY